MRGDFSRRTHSPDRHYSRVLLQQGRVVLDADWNEQVEIQLGLARRMMQDLVGQHGGPASALGFRVGVEHTGEGSVFSVTNGLMGEEPASIGRYYVDGILVEHAHLEGVPLLIPSEDLSQEDAAAGILCYLEVWERHVTCIEEHQPFTMGTMREVALGGPDTASRSQVRWRIGWLPFPQNIDVAGRGPGRADDALVEEVMRTLKPQKGTLVATLTPADIGEGDPCRDTAEDRYRGPENRLYRVEIHQVPESEDEPFTFKWSRENGSVVYPIHSDAAQSLTGDSGSTLVMELEGLGRDERYRLRSGDIVELVTAELDEEGRAGPLLEVSDIDETGLLPLVELRTLGEKFELEKSPWALLRRWDQGHAPKRDNGMDAKVSGGGVEIDGEDWFVLEDGIVVSFSQPTDDAGDPLPYGFQPGDYWLIPARTIPGSIEWPHKEGSPVPERPHGVQRYYAPLAIFRRGEVEDRRRAFGVLAKNSKL